MPEKLTAYDTGWRLEPRPWVQNGVTGANGDDPRPAEPDHYGRVDFDDDESNTPFTAWIQKNEDGSYIMRVEEHQDVELTIETSSQRQEREAAMQRLSAAMAVIAAEHSVSIDYADEDPETFGAGHFVFRNTEGNQRLAITEEYIGTDWSDDDRIPNGWSWSAEKYAAVDGTNQWVVTGAGEIDAKDVEQLVDEINGWARTRTREHEILQVAADQERTQDFDQQMRDTQQRWDERGISH